MRDKVKRFISILMTALMLVNLLPVGALAEGVKISNSVQSRAQPTVYDTDTRTVYIYVQVVNATPEQQASWSQNKDQWYTLGSYTFGSDVLPNATQTIYSNGYVQYNDIYNRYHKKYTRSIGVDVAEITNGMTLNITNATIPLEKVTWYNGTNAGFKLEDGATDFTLGEGKAFAWHLDGQVDAEDVESNYTIRYVDERSGKQLVDDDTRSGKAGKKTTPVTAAGKKIPGYTYVREDEPKKITVDGKTIIYVYYEPNGESVPVTYTTDGNGTLVGITEQSVGKVTGEPLTDVTATPKAGYNFVGWYKGTDKIPGDNPTLDAAKAKKYLNSKNNGYYTLYEATTFTAKFEKKANLSYTVNYYWGADDDRELITQTKSESTYTYNQEVDVTPTVPEGYTPMPGSGESKTITITEGTNEINFYYYKNVELTANSKTETYDGNEYSVSGFTSKTVKEGDPVTLSFNNVNVPEVTRKDAGTDTVAFNKNPVFEVDTTEKYIVTAANNGQLEIKKRPVTLTSETASKAYDGTALTKPNVTGGDGFVAGEVTEIKATGTITDVGSVTNTISYTPVEGKFNASNYDIAEKPGTLTVTKNEKVVVKVKGKTDTVTYDGDPHSVAGYELVSIEIDEKATDLYTKDDFEFDGQTNAKGTNANTYPMGLTADQFKNNNNNFENVKFEVVENGQLVITPRQVTLTSETASKAYDGTALTKPNVTGGEGFVEGEVSDVKATGSVTNVSEGEVTNAITYTKGEKFNANNYAIEKDEGKLSISKRSVKLTSASASKTYDGKPLTNDTVAVGGDGFATGEGATYKVTGSQTVVGSSENTFTYTLNDGTKLTNYNIELALGKLEVTPVTEEVIVTITGRTDEMPYDGKEHSVFGFDAKPSNKLYNPKEDMQFNGTDVDMTAKGTDAGQYDIGLTAEHFTNKSKTFTNVTFVVTDGYVKINPRAVTLTSETAGKTYDGTALEKPIVTVGGDGFVEGQVKEIKATGSVTNAGSVANTITFTPDKETFKEGNYAITKTEGTLTINKRSVLITSQSATKTYDGSALTRPAVTITGDGFVPGELAKAEATGSITNVGSTPNAIQYTTTGAFNAANYSIALSVGTLTVTEKPKPEPRRTFNLTINYVYQNGKRAAASYNRGGLKNGETFDITSPVIAGYTASETVVSGTIYNRDIQVTVIYTADGVNLDDYGVPLGLGNITMNVGDCFE